MKLGMHLGLGPDHIVLDREPAALPKRGIAFQFSAYICRRKMAGWVKMALGREVGLGPSDIVLDGDPAPLPQKGTEPPLLGLCLLWPNGWMDQDATWYGGRPPPRQHCARWGPSPPPEKKTGAQPPIFDPCLLWPNGWMDQDATWW